MKNFLITIALFLSILSYSKSSTLIAVSNTTSTERADELVVFSRATLQKKVGVIAANKYIVIKYKNVPQVVQFDDLNKDGQWDEAALLHSFKAKEKAVFLIIISNKPATIKAVVRAHVRQRHKLEDESFGPSVIYDTMPYNNLPTDFSKQKLPPYLTEGPAWENDKVGFRKYFDTRNTNDIWGKITSRMVLDEVGVNPAVIYHNFDSAWGMDILKVGKSLGAGALALQLKIDGKDSLVRLGSNTEKITYEQVADGPLRAIFRIKYLNWKITENLQPVTITEQISIWGGQYFYENKVTVTGAPADAKLVTGTMNFYSTNYDTISSNETKALYTYDTQSENHDKLGLGVIVNKKDFAGFGETPNSNSNVLNTYTVSLNINDGNAIVYRYVTGWEKTNPVFSTKEGFEKNLNDEMIRMAHPIRY